MFHRAPLMIRTPWPSLAACHHQLFELLSAHSSVRSRCLWIQIHHRPPYTLSTTSKRNSRPLRMISYSAVVDAYAHVHYVP